MHPYTTIPNVHQQRKASNAQLQAGFTLLELLVATTLLSLIMIGLSGALRSVAQIETRVDTRLQRIAEIKELQNFIAHTLNRVPAEMLPVPDSPGQQSVAFKVGVEELVWLGNMPARPDVGGRHFFRLAIEQDSIHPTLVLRYQPALQQAYPSNWTSSEARVIAKDAKALRFKAQGLPPIGQKVVPGQHGWTLGWPNTQYLPEQLQIEVEDHLGPWPLWIVPVSSGALGDEGIAITVIGGGRR